MAHGGRNARDRLLAKGRESECEPGTQPWFSNLKGDALNITFGKLYKSDVPKFRRAEREWGHILKEVAVQSECQKQHWIFDMWLTKRRVESG